jgi:deoxyribodipyrimidine photolyase-related protein
MEMSMTPTKKVKTGNAEKENAEANANANAHAKASSSANPKAAARAGTLRLILGDQLNPQHSWFRHPQDGVVYVLMEVRQETDYVLHHAQKILAIFAAMRDFARHLADAGHRVHYLAIDDPANQPSMTANLDTLIHQFGATVFECQDPDEWRLDAQLADYARGLKIPSQKVSGEHFYTERHEAAELFAGRTKWLMETFYRHMRVRHKVLIDDAKKPVGGQWNFDAENRKSWPGVPLEPSDARTPHDHSALWQTIVSAGVKSFGEPNADRLAWPLNRTEALQQLDAFIAHVLPNFGDFQDAMSSKAWRLFHSLLSFAMNTKMLSPREVVDKAEAAGRAGAAPMAAAEGFIRQILGWREYVRGFYWAHMPGYEDHNLFGHTLPLPSWFWTGQTKMRCMAAAIGQSLEQAHAHHIQRLMVIGNFALLAGLDPAEVHKWYLGVYIDAFEWVELPNTVGMSQFADGGLLATKPYVSSAAYIDRMSDYCKGCHYDKKLREGERACPFNALYWDFHARNKDKLANNPRIGMVYRQLEKMTPAAVQSFQAQADRLRGSLEQL